MILQQLQILKYSKSFLFSVGFLVLFLGVTSSAWAQTKEYANSQTNGKNSATVILGAISGGYSSTDNASIANVEDPGDAVDADETTSATMKARNVSILIGSFSGEAWLQMNYANTVEANKTTYIKIDEPETKGGLLSLDLLETVGGLLGLLDENILIAEAYDGSNSISSVSSTMTRDGEGNIYLAVTPSEDYDGVRIKLRSQSNLLGLSLGGGLDMKVYDAFYYIDGEDCGRPAMTYFEDSGVNIALLDFQDRNLENAIDEDENSFSIIKQTALLNVNVAGTQSQVFEYTSLSSEKSTLNIKLSLGSGGAINTDLLGSAEVVLYNGDDVVYERSLQSSLLNNTDALDLLNSGDPVTMTFAPGRQFDRVEVRLTSPIGLSVAGSALQIYDVQRYDDDAGCQNPNIPPIPGATEDPFDVPSCSSDLLDFDNVDFPHYAVDDNNESYATLYADSGEILGGGPTAGFIEMGLGETLPANKTTYVRIGYDEDVLDRLLGGSLGKLLSDLANNLLLGNQYIQVEAINGNDIVLNEDSSNAFEGNADGVVTIVEDKIGRYYLAITPDSEYDRIRITNHVSAVLPTGKKTSLDVYNACFETGEDSCFPANFTSYKGGGINLSLGDLSDVGVKDPYKAISDNSSEYSEINLGVAGIAANVYQTVHFNQPSKEGDHVQIRLMVEPSSTLSLDVLGAYKIKFFNGKEQVGQDYTLQEGLLNNIDLLALFNSGGTVTLDFEPEDTFDRVDIGAESLLATNVAAEPLRVYSVKRYGDDCPLSFTEPPFDVPACISDLIDFENADEVQNLLDEDFDSYATLKSDSGVLLGISAYEGYVEMGYGETIDPGITSYIRIDFDDGILEALIGGSLGNVVSGLLDGLALGDHYFTVDVKMDDDVVLSGSSKDAGAGGGNGEIRIVQDALGRFYIAVTPDEAYNRIRVTDVTDSAVGFLAEPNTMNVYGMCTEFSTDACLPAFATSYEYSGISLSVNDLGGAGVTNPEYVLDNNTQHYSEISNGTLGVAASTKQWIYFNTVSSASDAVLIKFDTQGGGVDLDLLGSLEIKAYKGNDEVATLDWSGGIVHGVNVLDLLSNGEIVEVPFAPGVEFDRISVGIKTLASASVFPPIHLYSVERCYDLDTYMISNPHIISKFKNN